MNEDMVEAVFWISEMRAVPNISLPHLKAWSHIKAWSEIEAPASIRGNTVVRCPHLMCFDTD